MRNLRRTSRRHQAGVTSEDFADFTVGQAVMTAEGFPGVVIALEDGPHAGNEQYLVELDGDLGGGEYSSEELSPIEGGIAANASLTKTAEYEWRAAESGYLSDDAEWYLEPGEGIGWDVYRLAERGTVVHDEYPSPYAVDMETNNPLVDIEGNWYNYAFAAGDLEEAKISTQSSKEVPDDVREAAVEAVSDHWASADYPELTEILVERPPLAHSERVAALQKAVEPLDLGMPQVRSSAIDEIPEGSLRAQFGQYPASGPEGVSYFKGEIDSERWVDCLLYYKGGSLVGVLNHFPEDMGPERKGNVLVMVLPEHRMEGIGSALWNEAVSRWNVSKSDQDTTPDGSAFLSRFSALTAGFWDRVLEPIADNVLRVQEESGYGSYNAETGAMASYDWCFARHNRRCFYPRALDEESTKIAGYAVWVSQDRGFCPREKWDGPNGQKACPAPSAPGPNSGEPNAQPEAWKSYADGGQRLGAKPAGDVSELTDHDSAPDSQTSELGNDLADMIQDALKPKKPDNPYSTSNPYSASTASLRGGEFPFHVTARWSDVQAKAKRIRESGHVRIISSSPAYLVGEVQGDTGIYQATLTREPGTKNVAQWGCTCAWASYSFGRSGRWSKFEGRLCSHSLALQYESQSRGWMGGEVTEDPETPDWLKGKEITEYQKPDIGKWRASSLTPVVAAGSFHYASVPGGFASLEEAATWMIEQANKVGSFITSLLQREAQEHHGEMEGLDHHFKGFASLLRKLKNKVSDPKQITEPFRVIRDVLRYTITLPEPDYSNNVQDCLWEIQDKGFTIIEEENSWARGDSYSSLQYNLQSNGSDVVFELQFHTSNSFDLKDKKLHSMYEEFRDRSTPLARRQQLWDEMTKFWDDIPIPAGAEDFAGARVYLRPVAKQAGMIEAPVFAMIRDMLSDGDTPNEVISTLVGFGIPDAPGMMTQAMALPAFEVKVNGVVAEVLDLLEGGKVDVRGVGVVPAKDCVHPDYHPTRGLTASKTAGEMTLYRGEGSHDHASYYPKTGPDALAGAWWTNNLESARGYAKSTDGGTLYTIEVDESEVEPNGLTGYFIIRDPEVRVRRQPYVASKTASADSTGCMVAIEPPKHVAEAIHADMVATYGDGVEPVTNYHVTLAYPGDIEEVDPIALESAVRDWAHRWGPLTGSFSGYGVFHQDNGDKVLYASVNLPGLDRARDDLVTTLAKYLIVLPDDYAFTPHMTLLYEGEGDTPTPPEEMPSEAKEEFTISEVSLVLGTEWKHISLESPQDLGAAPDTAWGELPWGNPLGNVTWARASLESDAESAVADQFAFENPESTDGCAICGDSGHTTTDHEAHPEVHDDINRAAELHDEPEAALPFTTGEDEEEASPDVERIASAGSVTDIVAQFQLTAGAAAINSSARPGEEADVVNIAAAANAHLAKTALKNFTPAEQRQIIEEGSVEGVIAGNLGSLDLKGTHYEALQNAFDAADVETEIGEDDLWLY